MGPTKKICFPNINYNNNNNHFTFSIQSTKLHIIIQKDNLIGFCRLQRWRSNIIKGKRLFWVACLPLLAIDIINFDHHQFEIFPFLSFSVAVLLYCDGWYEFLYIQKKYLHNEQKNNNSESNNVLRRQVEYSRTAVHTWYQFN